MYVLVVLCCQNVFYFDKANGKHTFCVKVLDQLSVFNSLQTCLLDGFVRSEKSFLGHHLFVDNKLFGKKEKCRKVERQIVAGCWICNAVGNAFQGNDDIGKQIL